MRILIIKASSLGDIIQAFPVLPYLKMKTHAEIDWVVEKSHAEIAEAHPTINQVYQINTHAWRKTLMSYQTLKEILAFRNQIKRKVYDVVFDLQGNLKSAWVLMHVKANKRVGFGWKTIPEWPAALMTDQHVNPAPKMSRTHDYLAIIRAFFHDVESLKCSQTIQFALEADKAQEVDYFLSQVPEKFILVCPHSAWENKCLSDVQLKSLLIKLKSYFFLIAWKDAKERLKALGLYEAIKERSLLLPPFSLLQLQKVMKSAKLVIAMDSLPLHLCGTTDTPSLGFFGPTSAVKYKPQGEKHQTICGSCPFDMQFAMRCPKLRTCVSGACMKDIDMEQAYQQINEMLR